MNARFGRFESLGATVALIADHDLTGLKGQRIRTHGSVHEADVPIILSRPVSHEYARRAEDARLHSDETFDYALNGILD